MKKYGLNMNYYNTENNFLCYIVQTKIYFI